MTDHTLSFEAICDWLRPIDDPEMQISLVELGLIYEATFDSSHSKATVIMTLTTPSCPAAGFIIEQIKKRLLEHELIKDAEVTLVFEPKWNPSEMASDLAKESLGLW